MELQNQLSFQLNAMPVSDGNMIYEPNQFYDDSLTYEENEDVRHQSNGNLKINEIMITDKLFYVAMSHDQVQQSIDLPLFVA